MIDRSIQSITDLLLRCESKLGLSFTSFLLSLFTIFIAVLYVQPSFKVVFHGELFSILSTHPFSFSPENHLQYRIFGPLLGYLLFLRGDNFYLLLWIFIVLFPAVVYYTNRKNNSAPIDSFIITCFITFSCVILVPLISPAYTDIITWFFIYLAFSSANRITLSAIFFSIALLNHESSLVLLPALILYSRWLRKSSFIKIMMAYLVACLPHFIYRQYVNAHTDTLYSFSFYLSSGNFSFVMRRLVLYLPAALFYAFKLWWVFPLGFIAWSFRQKKFLQCSIIASIISGGCMLAFIGYDYTRMATIAFPAVILSHEWFKEILEEKKLRKLSFILVVLNFMILQYHFNFDGAQPMFPWILNKVSAIFGTPLVISG